MVKKTLTEGRTMEACRKRGWLPGPASGRKVVGPGATVTVDLWGFVDVVAVQPGQAGMLLIQSTTFGHRLARCRKIVDQCGYEARMCLAAGNRIEVWGWALRKTGRRERWVPRRLRLCLEGHDLAWRELPDW